MRRILSSLCLVSLMVGAQVSALVHEIGHGLGLPPANAQVASAELQRGSAGNPGQDAADVRAYCEKCFHFAHVAGAVASYLSAAVGISSSNERAQATLAAAVAASAPQTRSRGPPARL